MSLVIFTSLFALIFLTGSVYGQTESGTINGTVTDSTGAVIPNAKVVAMSVGTGQVREVTTDDRGFYNAPNLMPGMYTVTAEAPNLAKKEIRAQVTVGARVEVNFVMTVGVTSTVIEVVGEGGVNVNTETATIGTVIDSQQIQQLPTLNRNPYTFAQYVGTASDGDPSMRGVGVAFNGLRSAGTNVLLNGAANNDEFTASVGQTVPLDSVQEYSVLTNNFTSEFGRATSAVVNLVTKNGTNEFHGSAYEFNRVSALATQPFYDKANGNDKQHYTRNQFGGSLGGPIKKEKLFFFGNAEWNRIRSSASQTNAVIDPAFLAYAASPTQSFFQQLGTLRSNATINKVFTLADAFKKGCTGACAAIPSSTPYMDQVNYSVPANAGAGDPQNQLLVVGSVQWNVSDRTTLTGTYALNKANLFAGTVSNSAYEGYDTAENIMQNSFNLAVTHSFSSATTMQNRIVFNRLNDFQPLGSAPISPGLYMSPSTATNAGVGGLTLMMPGYLPTTPGNGIPFGGPQNFIQYYQDWSHVMGRHTLRFGGSYNYIQDNRTFGAYETPVGAFATSGSGINNTTLNRFLGGYWGLFQGAIYPQGNFPCAYSSVAGVGCVDKSTTPPTLHPEGNVSTPVGQPSFSRSNRYQEFGLYIGDSWKATSKLTLSLGLRYEYFGVQHNNNRNLDSNYYFNGGGSNEFERIANGEVLITPDSPIGELWKPATKNFGPRVGFAYDVQGNGKTVIRGGYSIGYERNFGNVTFNVIQNPPNYSVLALQDGVDVPGGSMSVTTDPAGPLSGSGTVKAIPKVSLRAVNPNINQAYAQLYSLTVEHQVHRNLVIGFDFSGSHGVHLYDIANINRPSSGDVYLDTPGRLRATQYSNINFRNSDGISHYNALVARVQMNNLQKVGLTLNANYTYGHTLDELSDTFSSSGNQFNLGYLDPFNPRVDYGNSYLDIRNRFTMSAVWEIPFAKNTHGFVKQIADGWSVAPLFIAETGTPFSLYDCSNASTVCMYAMNKPGTAGIAKGAPNKLNPTSSADNFVYTQFCGSLNCNITFDSAGNPTGVTDAYYDTTPIGAPYSGFGYGDPISGTNDFGPYPSNMVGRNSFRGPGYWNVDLGIYKMFFLGERFRLQFRGELYNAFNHANLYVYGANADVSAWEYGGQTYLDSAKGYNPALTVPTSGSFRTVQLALRLTF
jgi:Carboxypeptidase regulatory-like domain